jgi:hypothetical protein
MGGRNLISCAPAKPQTANFAARRKDALAMGRRESYPARANSLVKRPVAVGMDCAGVKVTKWRARSVQSFADE